jgi:haloalkane dehalogenase
VCGIVYMESIVCPLDWNDWPESSRPIFNGLRSDAGDDLIMDRNAFIELILPQSIMRDLTEEEMAEYRRPFLKTGEDRRPMLSWPREIPIEGSPANVVEIVQSYARWLKRSNIPKLFINADPGAILVGRQREFCRSWANQEEVTVPGIHFIQEDSPDEIGHAISGWLKDIT